MRTENFAVSEDGRARLAADVDELLGMPFGNWHVETQTVTFQLRVTKKGKAQVHRGGGVEPVARKSHDRVKQHLLAADDPIFSILGADADKRRQVDAFLRSLRAVMNPPLSGLGPRSVRCALSIWGAGTRISRSVCTGG